jgi:hypothetical protein
MLLERHHELLVAYEEKSRNLEHAYDSLTHLSNRLTAMITTKFVKILERYRIKMLVDAFEGIYESE